jgi:hypothetical protein
MDSMPKKKPSSKFLTCPEKIAWMSNMPKKISVSLAHPEKISPCQKTKIFLIIIAAFSLSPLSSIYTSIVVTNATLAYGALVGDGASMQWHSHAMVAASSHLAILSGGIDLHKHPHLRPKSLPSSLLTKALIHVAGVIVFSLKPHSDASVITVVLIDNVVSGLQVQKPMTMTANMPIVPNALVVNVGDVTEVGIFCKCKCAIVFLV